MKRAAIPKSTKIILFVVVFVLTGASLVVYNAYKDSEKHRQAVLDAAKAEPKFEYKNQYPTIPEMLKLVNEERAKHNAPPLKIDPRLNHSAQLKAEDMHYNEYFGHVGKNGKHGYDYIYENVNFGECVYVNENILYDTSGPGFTSKKAIDGWIGSKSHHKEMIDPRYDVTGFGQRGIYAVQHFCDLA